MRLPVQIWGTYLIHLQFLPVFVPQFQRPARAAIGQSEALLQLYWTITYRQGWPLEPLGLSQVLCLLLDVTNSWEVPRIGR